MTIARDLHAARARLLSRRWFFGDCGIGLAGIAAGALAAREAAAGIAPPSPLAVKQPHYVPKAKRVVYMFQAGAPSHLEL